MTVKGYAKFLLIMAGLGGLLYGVDVGVIAAALPYIERTSTFNQNEIGWIVGMALWGSLPSSLVAGLLAEWFGRKKMIVASALLFLVSIPVICASGFFEGGNFWIMVGGRAMQGAAAGLFGVIVPMYLAECLDADSRGKGTGMFQLLLTIGLVFVSPSSRRRTRRASPCGSLAPTENLFLTKPARRFLSSRLTSPAARSRSLTRKARRSPT